MLPLIRGIVQAEHLAQSVGKSPRDNHRTTAAEQSGSARSVNAALSRAGVRRREGQRRQQAIVGALNAEVIEIQRLEGGFDGRIVLQGQLNGLLRVQIQGIC